MKIKKEFLILFGVIGVLLIALLFGGRGTRMSYRVPDLEPIDEDTITKIELVSKDGTTVLTGKGSRWTLLPQEYAADPDKVASMLEIISNLTLTELAAEARDYQRYELDEENKISVNAYAGDELKRTFDVGKVSSTYRHTFVRVDENPRVYFARESFRSTFEVEKGDLRDKAVMSFDLNEITGVSIEQEDSTLQFKKTKKPAEVPSPDSAEESAVQPAEEQGQDVWQTDEGTVGSKSEIDSIVSQLSDLKCDSYSEETSQDEFENPIYTVRITGSKDYSLQIFAKDEEADKYPAVSSETPYVFFLATWTAENIMKKADVLVEVEKEEN